MEINDEYEYYDQCRIRTSRFLSGTQYMAIGNDVGIWNHARVEVLDEWNGKKFSPKVIIGNHVNIGQNLHLTCAESIVIEDMLFVQHE